MTLIIRRPRTQQPQAAAVLNRGIPEPSFLWGVVAGQERSLIGAASSRQGSGTHAIRPTAAGLGLSSNGTTNRIQIADSHLIVCPASAAFSVLQVIRLNATGQTNRYAAIQFRSSVAGGGSSNCQQALIYGYAANSFEFYTDNYTGSDPRTGSAISVSDTAPHVILYAYDGATWSGYLDGRRVFSTSRTFTVNVTAATASPESCLLAANGGSAALDATLLLHAAWPVGLPDAVARSVTANPWQLFAPRRSLVPVSAGGGAISIDGIVGAATAAGTSGQVGVDITVAGNVGNATAAGTTAQVGVAIDIAGSVGAATAAGTTASVAVDVTVAGSVGNAVAAGITGGVDLGGNISIDGNVGAAVAAGVQGLPGVGITVNGSVGAASAAGISGTVSLGNDITISGGVGSAAAAGILASLALEINLAGAVGNATAAGVTGTVTLSGAEVFSAPPLVQRLETSTRIARTSASRSARLQSRNR